MKLDVAATAAPAAEMLSLAVGDNVVYGSHGAGKVEARETRSVHGEEQTVVVIGLAAGLSVQLPLALAQEQLRPVIDEAGIAIIEQVLRDTPPISSETWLKRRRDAETKLRDAIGLAEVIRDGHVRELAPARGAGSRLSPGERELARRARELLTKEIALARDVTVGDVDVWLDGQLGLSR